MLATLSRWRSGVQIPSGTLFNSTTRYESGSGEAQTFVIGDPHRVNESLRWLSIGELKWL